ncbi:MAG: lytic murein transglycosylase B [Limnohabitans sp.]|nr:lytic murein transglycosylase B [Limnohabitans sp.]
MRYLIRLFFCFLIALGLLHAPVAGAVTSDKHRTKAKAHRVITGEAFGQREDAMALAKQLAQKHQLPLAWTQYQIAHARFAPAIPQLVLPPAVSQAKNWAAYRERFIEPKRIAAGVAFWNAHQSTLEKAQATYGVPAHLIVAILGVETFYGQHMGAYRVIDALTTLSLHFPNTHPRAQERREFFQKELGYFLVQMRKEPSKKPILGSYAGAMGLPQFMPSSWAQFAVDFDGNGYIDLIKNKTDTIGSVAHYFQSFGWKTGMPTHYAVDLQSKEKDLDDLLAPDILPSFSVADLKAKGALIEDKGQKHTGPLALVELQNGGATPSYVIGTENFYVITRYNWSSYYAMAVIELSLALEKSITP